MKALELRLKSATEEIEFVNDKNDSLLMDKVKLEEDALYFELSDKNQKAIHSRLNKEMINSRTRILKEKVEESKSFRKEIKGWKKKLGKEKRKVINLKRSMSSTLMDSNMNIMIKIKEEKIMHTFNSSVTRDFALDKSIVCSNSPQCCPRQPLPPPHGPRT